MYNAFLKSIKQIQENGFRDFIHYCIFGFIGILILILVSAVLAKQKTKPIVTVNITQIVNQFVKAQAAQKLSQAETKKRITIFGKQLEITLNQLAQEDQVVLLPAEAVIAGAPDKTADVQKRLLTLQKTH
ncbi:hypothetical protein BH10PSE19_BH10PSE19_00120 [soil metagenome]